jgi:NADH:ubiquinone oxidoreductase subunit B-like Fe-S oxidoreductase
MPFFLLMVFLAIFSPEALLEGIIKLQEKILQERPLTRKMA